MKNKKNTAASVLCLQLALFSLAALLPALGLSVGMCAQDTAVVQPEEEDKDYTWDFGLVKEGDVYKHSFIIKNDSKTILNIKDVNTSCGCTVSQVKKKSLAPGEETEIEVKLDSKGYSGEVKQFIYAHTDSLDKPLIRYIIKAEVIKQPRKF